MSAVDPLFAQWLQAPADYAVRADAAAVARWGATALTTERLTGIATKAAAEAEANRQLTFFGRGPFAIDVHQFVGTDWIGALGSVVTIAIDQLGYDAGIDVFVLEAEIDRASGTSNVTVLRPLRSLS
ncbi:hypothetical protein [Sphingomonas sp.]|jgi:hypothetical protein|uniref:hypothetical protein n=1 Tax=Sphingomonas sp. TaxID=28214 RepID=UPI002ED9D470